MTKLDGKTPDLAAENIEQLRQIFPDVFEEGKIDFDKLKQVLGEYVDDEKERYNFTWNGKGKALRLAQAPTTGTLRPCEAESKNWDDTQNLYIEGDNLEVLKLLQKSYHGKIKMIYIDPPYNTGGDFIYPDDFVDSVENYKRITSQVDDEGRNTGTNTESNGRYHTDWLNMMYPRLRLARNLLKENGTIFISIDEHEVNNLKKLCNEVFGEMNFLACIANINNPKGRSDEKNFATAFEYIMVYQKREASLIGFAPEENVIKRYNKIDDDGRRYRHIDLRKTGDSDKRSDRPNMFYYFILDFFSGSSTTAHAVMQINAEDGGNRKFIMVQLPEPCADGTEAANAGFENICEIGKERIRRAGEKIKAEVEEQNAQLKIDEEPRKVPDIGFKVFKLDSSNLKQWQPDYDDLETTLFDSISNYVEGRSELDVVYEIMLKMGMELTWPLETHTIGGKNAYEIGMGALMICLDDQITTEVAEGMAALYKEMAPETWRVVFKDNGFADDSAKVNIKEILKTAGLEEDAFTTV